MPQHNDPQLDLGGASAAALRQVATEELSDIAVASEDPLRRSVGRLLTVVRKRDKQPGAAGDAKRVSIFLLVKHPRRTAERFASAHYPLFANGSMPLTGKIWLTQEALSTGYAIDFAGDEPAAAFAVVTSDNELNSAPAIVFDPRPSPREVRFYPRGLCHDDECMSVDIKNEALTAESVMAELEGFYQRCLLTPSSAKASPRIWTNAGRFFPAENTEGLIQELLQVSLMAAFSNDDGDIRHEQPSALGRADLLVWQKGPVGTGTRTCIACLELKVLRSFHATGTAVPAAVCVQAVVDGYDQIRAYKHNHDPNLAALCCYDMRSADEGNVIFEPHTEHAAANGISLCRWYLFNSSKAARQAGHPR